MKIISKIFTRYYKILQTDTSSACTHTITADCECLIEMIGGGGGGVHKYADNTSGSGSGAAGGYFKGLFQLKAGDVLVFSPGAGGAGKVQTTYNEITASAGTASTLKINDILCVTAGGGGGGYANGNSNKGSVTINNSDKLITRFSMNSFNGGYTRQGGAKHPSRPRTLSPFTNTLDGFGSGGGYSNAAGGGKGGAGAIRIKLIKSSALPSWDFRRDIFECYFHKQKLS